jgi:hypothetical protein
MGLGQGTDRAGVGRGGVGARLSATTPGKGR